MATNEDLGGWLIGKDEASEFEKLFLVWNDKAIWNRWGSCYCFAEWTLGGDKKLAVKFSK